MRLDPRRTYGPPKRSTDEEEEAREPRQMSSPSTINARRQLQQVYGRAFGGEPPQASALMQAEGAREGLARHAQHLSNIRERAALTRLGKIQEGWKQYPGRDPRSSMGPTGLLPGDAQGWSDMLNEQTEAMNLSRELEGKDPMRVERASYQERHVEDEDQDPNQQQGGMSAARQAMAMKRLEESVDAGVDPDSQGVDDVLQELWGRDNAYDQAVQQRSRGRLRERYGARRG